MYEQRMVLLATEIFAKPPVYFWSFPSPDLNMQDWTVLRVLEETSVELPNLSLKGFLTIATRHYQMHYVKKE